jgi:hypothetical protein
MDKSAILRRKTACRRFAFGKPFPVQEREPPPAVQLNCPYHLGYIIAQCPYVNGKNAAENDPMLSLF